MLTQLMMTTVDLMASFIRPNENISLLTLSDMSDVHSDDIGNYPIDDALWSACMIANACPVQIKYLILDAEPGSI